MQTVDLGLGFGVFEDSIQSGNAGTTFVEPVSTNNTVMKPVMSGSVFDTVAGVILGTDENGVTNPFDLSKILKLPDVNVKADKTQWWWIVAILIGSFLGIKWLIKKNR